MIDVTKYFKSSKEKETKAYEQDSRRFCVENVMVMSYYDKQSGEYTVIPFVKNLDGDKINLVLTDVVIPKDFWISEVVDKQFPNQNDRTLMTCQEAIDKCKVLRGVIDGSSGIKFTESNTYFVGDRITAKELARLKYNLQEVQKRFKIQHDKKMAEQKEREEKVAQEARF